MRCVSGFSYNHEKSWLFGRGTVTLHAFGSANATHNSTGKCAENCFFSSACEVVEDALARFPEGWSTTNPVGRADLDDVERCKERRREKSLSRARSQSEYEGAFEEPGAGSGTHGPANFVSTACRLPAVARKSGVLIVHRVAQQRGAGVERLVGGAWECSRAASRHRSGRDPSPEQLPRFMLRRGRNGGTPRLAVGARLAVRGSLKVDGVGRCRAGPSPPSPDWQA